MKKMAIILCILISSLFSYSENIKIIKDANIRSEPNTQSKVIRIAKVDEVLKAQIYNENWFEIDNDGNKAYINKGLVVIDVGKNNGISKPVIWYYIVYFILTVICLNVFKNMGKLKALGATIILIFSLLCSFLQKGDLFDNATYIGLSVLMLFIILSGGYLHARKDGKADRRYSNNPYLNTFNDGIRTISKIVIVPSVCLSIISIAK